MLNKNSESRPFVRSIVRTEYVVKHISKLLSYTLKKNSAGLAVLPGALAGNNIATTEDSQIPLISHALLPASSAVPHSSSVDGRVSRQASSCAHEGVEESILDPEVAERRIEQERARQREADIRKLKEDKDVKVSLLIVVIHLYISHCF